MPRTTATKTGTSFSSNRWYFMRALYFPVIALSKALRFICPRNLYSFVGRHCLHSGLESSQGEQTYQITNGTCHQQRVKPRCDFLCHSSSIVGLVRASSQSKCAVHYRQLLCSVTTDVLFGESALWVLQTTATSSL